MAERAVAMAREAPEDRWCGLAAPSDLARDWDVAALELEDAADGPTAAALEAAGFLVVAIRPPTVPAGTARLRVAFSAAHDEAQVDALAEAVAALTGRA